MACLSIYTRVPINLDDQKYIVRKIVDLKEYQKTYD